MAGLLLATPVIAQGSGPSLLEYGRIAAGLIGLSPEGTELWARKSVEWARTDDFRRLNAVERAIGEELARPSPDRARLMALTNDYVAERSVLARREKQQLIDAAFDLSPADRARLGRFIERASADDDKPVPRPFPTGR